MGVVVDGRGCPGAGKGWRYPRWAACEEEGDVRVDDLVATRRGLSGLEARRERHLGSVMKDLPARIRAAFRGALTGHVPIGKELGQRQ